jgi:hypothetical protein
MSALRHQCSSRQVVLGVQEQVEAKRKRLAQLESGAQGVARAAAAPCTDLNVSAVVPEASSADTASAEAQLALPEPLSLLAAEMRVVKMLYGVPIEVRFPQSCLARGRKARVMPYKYSQSRSHH